MPKIKCHQNALLYKIKIAIDIHYKPNDPAIVRAVRSHS